MLQIPLLLETFQPLKHLWKWYKSRQFWVYDSNFCLLYLFAGTALASSSPSASCSTLLLLSLIPSPFHPTLICFSFYSFVYLLHNATLVGLKRSLLFNPFSFSALSFSFSALHLFSPVLKQTLLPWRTLIILQFDRCSFNMWSLFIIWPIWFFCLHLSISEAKEEKNSSQSWNLSWLRVTCF